MLAFVFAILSGLMPALAQPAVDVEYVVRFNGLLCVRAPCPSYDATEVATGRVTRVTGIDVDAVASGDAQRERIGTGVLSGWFVAAGRIEPRGRGDVQALVFVVTRIVRRTPDAPANVQLL
jgi:hypothetical protein